MLLTLFLTLHLMSFVTMMTNVITKSPSLCSSISSCSVPLGLESGDIKDDQITASSSYSSSVEASKCRLHGDDGGGAWCPSRVLTNNSVEWIQVELGTKVLVTGVIVQGRWDRGLGQEWAQSVKIQFWSQQSWVQDGDKKLANVDTFTPVLIKMSSGVVTDKIRVIPVTEYPRTVCIRLELCGCDISYEEVERDTLEMFEDVHDEVHDMKEEKYLVKVNSPPEQIIPKRTSSRSNSNFMSLVIGVLVTVILILTVVIIFILYSSSGSSSTSLTTSTVPKYSNYMTEYHTLPPMDHTSHYSSNDSYSEYSRPLLGTSGSNSGNTAPSSVGAHHKLLWDISFPPPPPLSPSSSPRYHQPSQQHHHCHHQQTSAGAHHYASTSVIRRLGDDHDVGHPV